MSSNLKDLIIKLKNVASFQFKHACPAGLFEQPHKSHYFDKMPSVSHQSIVFCRVSDNFAMKTELCFERVAKFSAIAMQNLRRHAFE